VEVEKISPERGRRGRRGVAMKDEEEQSGEG
jgi:hypothetical protein